MPAKRSNRSGSTPRGRAVPAVRTRRNRGATRTPPGRRGFGAGQDGGAGALFGSAAPSPRPRPRLVLRPLPPLNGLALVALAATLFIVVNSVLAYQSVRVLQDREQWVSHTDAVRAQVSRVLTEMDDAETGERGYVITGDDDFLQPYTRTQADIRGALAQLQTLTSDNSIQQRRIATLDTLIPQEMRTLQATIDLRKANRTTDAMNTIANGPSKPTMNTIRGVLEQMDATEAALLHSRDASAQAALTTTTVTFVLAALTDIALLAIVFALVRRALAQRERVAEERTQLYAREQAARTRAEAINARLRTVLDVLPAGVALADAGGRIRDRNAAFTALWKRDTLPSENATNVLGNDDAEADADTYAEDDASGYQGWWPGTDQRVAPEAWPLARALASGEVCAGEEIAIDSGGGQRRVIFAAAAPIRDEAGAIAGAVAVEIDITERKRLEQALRASEAEAGERAQQLEATFEAMGDAVFVYDASGKFQQMNSAARALLGLSAEPAHLERTQDERVTRYAMQNGEGEPLAPEQWPVMRILRGERLTGASAMDIIIETLDGRRLDLNFSGAPVRDDEGRIIGAVGVCRDVTERRNLERRTHDALTALLAMAEALVASPGDTTDAAAPGRSTAIAERLAELTEHVLGCTRVALTTFDLAADTMRPLAVTGLSPDQERHMWATIGSGARLSRSLTPDVLARLATGEVLVHDIPEALDGSERNPYAARSVLLAPMRLGNELVGVVTADYGSEAHVYTENERALGGAVASLTALVIERQRLLREREEAQAHALALDEANRRMDEFLGIASHELRTPLTSIRANIQLAKRRMRKLAPAATIETTDDELAQRLGSVHLLLERTDGQTHRLDRLVGDLLDVSRIQAGKLEMRPEPADLGTIVREAVIEQRQATPTRTLTLDVPALPIPILADADRIGQVVTNYLTNALKYSPEQTAVAVRVRVEGARARVLVRDQGPGLPPEEYELIWERFHRVPGIQVQSGSGVGLGLGLHICKTIIERHSGTVGVESTPGEGATFWFTLPLEG